MKHLYEHGLPFSEKLAENLKDLVDRIRFNKASMIIVDGGVGEGKTTLMVEMADHINSLYDFPDISLELKNHPQLALGGADFLKQLRLCYEKKLVVIIYDEAGDFNRRGALTRFNAMLNRTFETFRGFKILVILGLPSFSVLDSDIMNKQIPRLLLHVSQRTEESGHFKGYSLYRMMYIKDKMKKLVVKPFAYDLVEPNFYGHFLDLDPVRANQLDKISTKGKMDVLKKAEVQIEGLMNYSEMAKKLGRSVVWARMVVSKLRIKPTRLISRVRYFDETIVNRLADYLEEGGLKDDKKKK